MEDKNHQWKAWLEAIDNNRTRELTEWEEKFLETIRMKLKFNWKLSDSQAAHLEQIYAEKTA